MKRSSSIPNSVIVLVAAIGALGMSGCLAPGASSEEHVQSDPEFGHPDRVGAETNSGVARDQAGLATSEVAPLGAAIRGPQPQPWNGSDPTGSPQPDPLKHDVPLTSDRGTSSASSSK